MKVEVKQFPKKDIIMLYTGERPTDVAEYRGDLRLLRHLLRHRVEIIGPNRWDTKELLNQNNLWGKGHVSSETAIECHMCLEPSEYSAVAKTFLEKQFPWLASPQLYASVPQLVDVKSMSQDEMAQTLADWKTHIIDIKAVADEQRRTRADHTIPPKIPHPKDSQKFFTETVGKSEDRKTTTRNI